MSDGEHQYGVDLYWLPLGARGHSVRLNGRVFEAVAARLDRRDHSDLYHSALLVYAPDGRFVIEQGPVWQKVGADRGVVVEGAVGARAAGRFKLFGTKFDAGATASSRISTKRLTVRSV